MSPQFVDFDHDGHLDVVAGTFDGSPHVALGSAAGWQKPTTILDGQGQRIMMNQFWNYDEKKWDSTHRCDPLGIHDLAGHLTSAFAWDYDEDGDFDLLLGDYDEGRLFLRVNDGKPGEPKFRSRNETIEVAGKPMNVGKVGTMRVVDWGDDGLMDVVVSSMGNRHSEVPGGGVYLFTNMGSTGRPIFQSTSLLVAPGKTVRAEEPQRPDQGLYVDVADADNDGDLDLLVGGYSTNAEKRQPFIWFYEQRGSRRASDASSDRR